MIVYTKRKTVSRLTWLQSFFYTLERMLAVIPFDVAIEYQNGRANIKTTSINILKGFFACSLVGVVPVELYKFCISLQNTFAHDLSAIFAGGRSIDLAGESTSVLVGSFSVANNISFNLFNILALIAFSYCVIKIFSRTSSAAAFCLCRWRLEVCICSAFPADMQTASISGANR